MRTRLIAIVGDDPEGERYLRRRLKGYTLERFASLAELPLEPEPPALVIHEPEAELDDADADHLVELRELGVPFVIVSRVETMKAAVTAMRLGAYDYFLHSDDRDDLVEAVLVRLEPPRAAPPAEVLDEESDLEDVMIGKSPGLQEVFKLIGKIAESNVSVLLRGESGTGKELVARQIHKNSSRRRHPIVSIDCAAIPRELVENELFGHEAGAYSGAEGRALGKFDQADHGTIFLDEVSEMDLDLQAKILRVIQESTFDRVGGSKPVRVDVRLIVATQADLEQLVAEGRFRSDLYHRLNVITLELPPLREHREDIPLLAHHFVHKHCRLLGLPERKLASDFLRRLERYDWPGNVRELENLIRRGLLVERGPVITGRFLELSQSDEHGLWDEQGMQLAQLIESRFLNEELNWKRNNIYKQMTGKLDRLLLRLVLRHTRGNQVSASRILGISRNTLRVRMQELGISSDSFR